MLSRKRIEEVLLLMRVPAGVKGFTYIADAVLMYDDPKTADLLVCNIYRMIAKRHGTNEDQVERAIRNAFNRAVKNGEPEVVRHYIGNDIKANGHRLKMLHTVLKHEQFGRQEEIKSAKESIDVSILRMLIRQEIKAIFSEISREDGFGESEVD